MTDATTPETPSTPDTTGTPDTLCPDCGQPRPTDDAGGDPGVCTNPACPAGDQAEIAANEPTGGDGIGA